jgi:magnesium transporter
MVTILATRDDELLAEPKVEDLPRLLADKKVNLWVDIEGQPDEQAQHIVRDVFKFHPHAIEDCFGAREHPKIVSYDSYVYVITHGLSASSTPERPETIELDAFISKRYLVTYHAKPSRSVGQVIDLVKRSGDLLRRGPAAVLHAVLERQADGIEDVIDGIDESIAELEDRVVVRPKPGDLRVLLRLRRAILQLRRWMTRQRDVVMQLARNEFSLSGPQEMMAFRDVYDHLQRFSDLLENYRELTTSVQEAYLTMTSNRLNEVMKFLTVFTSVLMPLTVLAGIWGMNFEHMPELHKRWGYPVALGTMVAVGAAMLWFFHRRGWIGRDLDGTEADSRDTIEAP